MRAVAGLLALISPRLVYSLTVLALNCKTPAVSHMVGSRFPLTVGFAVLLPCPQSFSILNTSCSLCVTSTRIPTTHHIILAAPDRNEHSETPIGLVSLDKDVLTASLNPAASRRQGFCRPRHSGRN